MTNQRTERIKIAGLAAIALVFLYTAFSSTGWTNALPFLALGLLFMWGAVREAWSAGHEEGRRG